MNIKKEMTAKPIKRKRNDPLTRVKKKKSNTDPVFISNNASPADICSPLMNPQKDQESTVTKYKVKEVSDEILLQSDTN